MIIGIDVSSLARTGLTGIGVYIKQLVSALKRIDGVEVRPYFRSRVHARRDLIADHLNDWPYRYVPFISDRAVDVFHGPDFRLPRMLSTPSVVTVHDLAVFEPKLLAEDFAERGREKIKRLIYSRRPDRVIAISAFTAERLYHHFPSVDGRVDVVHLGYDSEVVVDHKERLPSGIDSPFVLHIGTIERRKNVLAVVKAFELIRQNGSRDDLRLVIAGGDGFDSDAVHRYIDGSVHRDAITCLGFVSDDARAALYQCAGAFIYPSLYEGFGLPVLEAMAAGCPVVTTNAGAVAEVAGDAAMLVSPDATSIADAMRAILNDPSLRQSLIDKGLMRAAKMTWDECARKTLDVYKRVVGQ